MSPDLARLVVRIGLCLLFPLLAAPAGALPEEEVSALLRQPGRILLHSAWFDVAGGPPDAPPDLALAGEGRDGVRFWLVHVPGPLTETVRTGLESRGAEILSYVPNHAYLVRASPDVATSLGNERAVDWVGPYRPDYKLSPGIGTRVFTDPYRPAGPGELLLTLSLFPGEDPDAIAAEAAGRGAEVLYVVRHPVVPRITVRVPAGGERRLALLEGIEWIEEVGEITFRNNTTRWVAQSNQTGVTSVWDRGIHGEGQIIGHIDGGIWMDSCFFEDLLAPGNTPGPMHRKVVAYRGPLAADAHGTHTAGTAAGSSSGGGLLTAGLAYGARLSHTRLSQVTFAEGSLYGFLEAAHLDGGRVHANSWGDDGTTAYTTWCRDIDRFSRDYEESLVLFAVTNTTTLKTPENAKNVLAVGATLQAPNQHAHGSGGRGPTADGRRKPEIYLPGIGIVSASAFVSCDSTSLSGTSMACPAVTACGALVRQYLEEGFYPTGLPNATDARVPTGALVKATLLNGAVDMTGVAGYPSDREGWGRLLLEDPLFFAGDPRRIVIQDVRNPDGLSTGDLDEYLLDVGSGLSLEITMVFTDQPAALAASFTPINDLDLEVEGPDGIFLGNVFAAGFSTTGGVADNRNDVERVRLDGNSFTPGVWTVRVLGTSVPDGPQGYALHVSGEVQERDQATGADVASRLASRGSVFLGQNEPNPFRAATSIRFSLPERDDVHLSVFDIAGRRVRTLAEGPFEPGEYRVDWDGRDFLGESVAPGIYFYRLEGTEIDETRKLVVLR